MSCLVSSLPVLYSLRLVGGRNRSEGYVQIFGQSWTAICTDDFDMIDAAVACRDLGYNYATTVVYDGRFSRDELGTGYPWTVSFDCSGDEQRLYACPRRFSPGCRPEDELVGVVCSQTSTCVCAICTYTVTCTHIHTYAHVCMLHIHTYIPSVTICTYVP